MPFILILYDFLVVTFDLMQNPLVSALIHGSMFYLRQLWVCNFGVHVTTTGSATMYFWNESIAVGGAVASYPGRVGGEKRPGIHCIRMREIFSKFSVKFYVKYQS